MRAASRPFFPCAITSISGNPRSRNASSSRAGRSSSTITVLIVIDFPSQYRIKSPTCKERSCRRKPRRSKVLRQQMILKGRVFERAARRVIEPGGVRKYPRHCDAPRLGSRAARIRGRSTSSSSASIATPSGSYCGNWSPDTRSRTNTFVAALLANYAKKPAIPRTATGNCLISFPAPDCLSERMVTSPRRRPNERRSALRKTTKRSAARSLHPPEIRALDPHRQNPRREIRRRPTLLSPLRPRICFAVIR